MWDVVVVGAGPSGSIAAFVLAKGGCSVLLVGAEGGCCNAIGETLPAAALRILRSLGIKTPEETGGHQAISGSLSSWGSNSSKHHDSFRDPEGPPWRVNRLLFDSTLRKSASEVGAVFISSKVKQVDRTGSCWSLQLNNGIEISSRWLVDAGGRKSGLPRQLGARRHKDVSLIALYALSHPMRPTAYNCTVIEAVPDGWWYAAALPCGRILAGFHTSPLTARQVIRSPDVWRVLLQQSNHIAHIYGDLAFEERLAPMDASGGLLNKFCGPGWICCGDAALSFDPLSSQGLMTALYTGMLAGRRVLIELNGNLAFCEDYTEQLLSIRKAYRTNLLQTYRDEPRWRKHDFWRIHQENSARTIV